jgi:NAD(P)-dependent dehydrogenase (short-subunit alcohol dehydrogenase family)
MTDTGGRRRAAVVTGGGGGIGTAVALELARRGVAVVAMDPGVGVQGEPLNEPTAARTAQLITAQGGVARASTASVTDRAAVRSLFAGVAAEFGGLDIVVNTAGILRFAPFLQASEEDWRAVLGVHLDGYLNVLAEAVPLMQAAGYGRIVGVTSGAGLARAAADNAPYSAAKRAVAAVTWQLAGLLPDEVALNALSPLAATRMISSALTGGRPADRTRSGGLDLSGMPAADDMAPAAAFLASEQAGSCRGRIIFSAGPELSVISPPQLIEAIRTGDTADFAAALDTLVPVVIGPAETGQRSTGGANARFGPVFDQPGTAGPAADPDAEPRYALLVAEHPALARALAAALARCGLTAVDPSARPVLHWPAGARADPLPSGFTDVDAAVARAAHITGALDAVVIAPGSFAGTSVPSAAAPAPGTPATPGALAAPGAPPVPGALAAPGAPPVPGAPAWAGLLAGFAPVTDQVLVHVAWLQAAARLAVRTSRPLRIVHLTDATSRPQHAAAQAVAQLARCATVAEPGLIDVFSLALETASPAEHDPVAQLAARLLWSGDTTALRGAELFARDGWIGLRAHPAPLATVSYGTPALPAWIGDWLRESVSPRWLSARYLVIGEVSDQLPVPRSARSPRPPSR